jgi:predicted CoA-binding protein
MNTIISEILSNTKTIAVVGLSANPDRPSYDVALYMQKQGFRIIPVNPNEEMILGEKSYPNLSAIPFNIDLVNVFRKSQDCSEIVTEAVKVRVKYVWLQLGVINLESQEIATNAGINFVMDRCLKIEHFLIKNE